MNNMENIPVEQLWYTWSDVGLSSIHAGFRIRAASPGLTEIYSERVKSMDRYMRYVLPPDTNRATITPETAPVGLAFIRTDWNNEYILVHKNYSGKDGVGRPGNFFVHVLALGENSSSFSVEDAIWLWDAEFWRTNDQGQDRRSNTLETLPFAVLDRNPRFHPQFAQVQRALPFLIEAYLSRKEGTRLYIAAPAHQSTMIVYLIAGLVNCLPGQLVADLTFSTYEPDITKATTEIVGTSWIATPGKEHDASQVLPPQWYRDHLAINCATGEHSPLQRHPQATDNSLAADFAAYATDCLVTNNMEQIYDLRAIAEKSRHLTIDMFLRLYNNEIANAESMGKADIEAYLNNPDLCLDRLRNRNFRLLIIKCALDDSTWNENRLKPILAGLCRQAEREALVSSPAHTSQEYTGFASEQLMAAGASFSTLQKKGQKNKANSQTKKNQDTLAETLIKLAQRAISEIVDAMKKGWAARGTVAGLHREDTLERQKVEQASTLIHLMNNSLPALDISNTVWKKLLEDLLAAPTAVSFYKVHWSIAYLLLQIWDKALPISPDIDNKIRPLVIVPWNRLGKFLKVSLRDRHRQWNVFALEKLLPDPSPTLQDCRELEQSYAQEIYDVLAFLLQEGNFALASGLMMRLVENNFRVKPPLDTLIDQLLTALQSSPRVSLQAARDLVATLTRAGYLGTPSYQNLVETLLSTLFTIDQRAGYELLDLLAIQKYPRKKALVDIVLHSSRGYVSQESITKIITRVYQSPGEQNAFFLLDGAHYLASREQILAMISLYQVLLQYFPQSKKLERLFVLLDAPLDQDIVSQVLNQTKLEGYEPARVLERYGQRYLQESSTLGNKVVGWFASLVQAGYPDVLHLLSTLWTPTADYRHLEHLLATAQLSLPDSRTFFNRYGVLAECAEFFQQSTTTLTLFSRLAQAANSYAGSQQGEQLAAEKMELLFAWMDPSNSPPEYRDVDKILQTAALTEAEQIAFLERCGASYLLLIPRLTPSLMKYINTYIENFTTDTLDREPTRHFFAALSQNYKRLPLDANTRDRIQCWAIIDNYCFSPDMHQETLNRLEGALSYLLLPNKESFTVKLASTFVSCITTDDDLSTIMNYMQQVPKIRDNMPQFLYTIAEQAAARYQQLRDEKVLLPYLVFVLTWNGQGETKHFQHFIHVFLDTLFYYVDVVNIKACRKLNDQLTLQRLPHDAMKRWEFYLEKLDLWSRLNAAEGDTTGAVEPKAGFWSGLRKRIGKFFGRGRKSVQSVSPDQLTQHSPSVQARHDLPAQNSLQPDMHAKHYPILPHKVQRGIGLPPGGDPPAEQQKQASQDAIKIRYEEDSKDRRKT